MLGLAFMLWRIMYIWNFKGRRIWVDGWSLLLNDNSCLMNILGHAHFLLPRSVKARQWVTTFLPNKYNLWMSHVNLVFKARDVISLHPWKKSAEDVKWSPQSLLKASAALIQSWICCTVEAVVKNYCSRCSWSHCCQSPKSLLHFQLYVNQPRFIGKTHFCKTILCCFLHVLQHFLKEMSSE